MAVPTLSSASKTSAPPDTPAEVASHRWWILIGLIMAAALEILDTTVVNVSLPQMAGKGWDEAKNYNLCLDTSSLPLPEIADFLTGFIRRKTAAAS